MGNPTRFMVSWDDHSTHLVARLGHLLERQQLVDVTLMCNTHSLKVHRSVLAACSPYFERELGNHPMIVLKDMKFSVLKSLIEFMYCGETNVTEDNLHALVEAAKFFEVKGLSSLHHESLQDSKSIKPPSLISSTTAQTRICQVSSSPSLVTALTPKSAENGNFSSPVSVIARLGQNNNNTNEKRQCAGRGRPKAHLQSPCCDSLVSKPAPITPPQTESAQILLSLAGSSQSYISPSKHKTNDGSTMIVNHQEFPMSNGLDISNSKFTDHLEQKYKPNRKRPADSIGDNKYDIKKCMPNDIKIMDEDVNRSPLLASLLTKTDKPKVQKPQETQTQSSERYINALKGAGLPTDIPILIENGDGNYITLTENVYDILAKEDALHFQLTDNMNLANLKQPEEMINNMPEEVVAESNAPIMDTRPEDPILKNIKSHSPPDNPDDVILYKVADDGNIEKYVLTTEDIKAFKESMSSNPERKKNSPMLSVSEINVPLENKSSPLITKILDCGNEKFSEALLGCLPLRKRGTFKLNNTGSDADMLQQMNNVCTQSSNSIDPDVEYVVVGNDSVQIDMMGAAGSSGNKNIALKNENNLKDMEDAAAEEMSVLEAMMNNTIEFSADDADYQIHSSEEVFSNNQNDNEKMILSNVLMCTGAESSSSHVGLDHFGFKSDDVDGNNGDCNRQKKSKMYVDLDLTGSDFISEPVGEEVVLAGELNPNS